MPAGLFAVADLVAAANLRAGRALFEICWLSLDGRPVVCAHGQTLTPQASLATAGTDAVLVPGLWTSAETDLLAFLQTQPELIAVLQRLPADTALWSYCTGVALLAASGRLAGQPATATWWLAPLLERLFPQVQWHFDEPLVLGEQVCTAAGASGHLPLILQQLAWRMDEAQLRELQEVLMLPQPRQRHAAFRCVELLTLQDPWLRRLLLCAQRTPATALNLQSAAEQMNSSPRSLCRHVQLGTGVAAGEWLRLIKLRQAAERLARGTEPVKTLCEALGFSGEAALHRMFKRATGLTPAAYRRAFGASA
ncbi:MAG: helix-turn-helix domain-containing protein [Burkholderiaceae bacterium]|nr:helix-turn-helix domain-containing protein [Burkholderiaceae bacterium]